MLESYGGVRAARTLTLVGTAEGFTRWDRVEKRDVRVQSRIWQMDLATLRSGSRCLRPTCHPAGGRADTAGGGCQGWPWEPQGEGPHCPLVRWGLRRLKSAAPWGTFPS